MRDHPFTLAVDLGGTRMRAGVVTELGEVVVRRVEATPRDAECPDALMSMVGDILADQPVEHAVIGVPGRVNHRSGRLEHAPNLPERWPQALDEQLLADRLRVPVSIANDADLAAVGEAYFGAAHGHDDIVYLTVSTGVGAGVLLDRRVVTGTRSLAEVGHSIVEHAAAVRGEPASLEELGSGTALARRASRVGVSADGARIVALVHDGDPDAIRVWNELVSVIATGVLNLAHLFAPSAIVLGGGVGRNGDLLLKPIREALDRRGPRGLPTPIEVLVAGLGDDAALVGAAGWLDARSAPCHG